MFLLFFLLFSLESYGDWQVGKVQKGVLKIIENDEVIKVILSSEKIHYSVVCNGHFKRGSALLALANIRFDLGYPAGFLNKKEKLSILDSKKKILYSYDEYQRDEYEQILSSFYRIYNPPDAVKTAEALLYKGHTLSNGFVHLKNTDTLEKNKVTLMKFIKCIEKGLFAPRVKKKNQDRGFLFYFIEVIKKRFFS